MLRSALVGALVLASAAGLTAQTAEQEVMKAEQVRLEARRKADSATLTRLAPDDQLTVGPNGQLQDKKATAALAAVPKASTREVKSQVFGDVAVVTGIQSGFGEKGDIEQRFTRIWRKQGAQWLNVFGQVTRIATPPPAAASAKSSPVAPTQWPETKTQDERDVLRVQRTLNEAFASKDAKGYALHTADTFVRINPDGSLSSRAELLTGVAATPDVKRVVSNNSDLRVRFYGPVASVTYVDRTPTGPAMGNRMTRVFVKQDNSWKQLVTQVTTIVPTP